MPGAFPSAGGAAAVTSPAALGVRDYVSPSRLQQPYAPAQFLGDKTFWDRVGETTSSVGTGDITMGGALLNCRVFYNNVTQNSHFDYAIEGVTVTGEWEAGHGVWDGSVMKRISVYKSSNSNALVNFSAGSKNVFITLAASTTAALDPFVNVDDLGAVGDGVTDDTSAIQAALDTGAHQIFASKTYLVTRSLRLSVAQVLTGPRRALLIDSPISPIDPRILFRPTNGDRVCIKNKVGTYSNGVEDMAVDLNDPTHTAIQFGSSYGNTVRRAWFYGTFNIGVLLHDTYVCNLEDLIMNGAIVRSYCVFVSSNTQAIVIRRLHTSGFPYDNAVCMYGIAVDGGYALTLADCVIQGATIGIAMGASVTGSIIDNPYFENTLCNVRLGNANVGPNGSGYVMRGGLFSAPYNYHPQYANRGPICYLNCGRAVFDSVSFQSTADNSTGQGPWPFVLSQYVSDVQFNNCTHFAGTTRNLFYREVAGASARLTVIGGNSGAAPGNEIILKDTDNYGTNCHGISVNGAGTITATAYQPAVIFGPVDPLLQTALPTGASLVL